MSRLSIKSTRKTAAAVPLILALLAGVPFADGLLLHEHSDHGIHSHAVILDELREGGLCASWYRYHDDIHDEIHDDDRNEKSDDTDGDHHGDSLFIFVSHSATARGIHRSSGPVIASIPHFSSKVMPRSMLLGTPTDTDRFSAAAWPSAHPMRPACALDALLQSSHALLL